MIEHGPIRSEKRLKRPSFMDRPKSTIINQTNSEPLQHPVVFRDYGGLTSPLTQTYASVSEKQEDAYPYSVEQNPLNIPSENATNYFPCDTSNNPDYVELMIKQLMGDEELINRLITAIKTIRYEETKPQNVRNTTEQRDKPPKISTNRLILPGPFIIKRLQKVFQFLLMLIKFTLIYLLCSTPPLMISERNPN